MSHILFFERSILVVVVVVKAVTGYTSECVDKTHYDSRCVKSFNF